MTKEENHMEQIKEMLIVLCKFLSTVRANRIVFYVYFQASFSFL